MLRVINLHLVVDIGGQKDAEKEDFVKRKGIFHKIQNKSQNN